MKAGCALAIAYRLCFMEANMHTCHITTDDLRVLKNSVWLKGVHAERS